MTRGAVGRNLAIIAAGANVVRSAHFDCAAAAEIGEWISAHGRRGVGGNRVGWGAEACPVQADERCRRSQYFAICRLQRRGHGSFEIEDTADVTLLRAFGFL
jgi:hypothetical protein